MSMKILVVDDHPNLARITALALRTLGCATVTAHTTTVARCLLAEQKFDGVFLDVNLGAESGMEFLSELRTTDAAPPVIVFTAQDREEVALEAHRRGALGCLIKPYVLDDVRALLELLAAHRGSSSP